MIDNNTMTRREFAVHCTDLCHVKCEALQYWPQMRRAASLFGNEEGLIMISQNRYKLLPDWRWFGYYLNGYDAIYFRHTEDALLFKLGM